MMKLIVGLPYFVYPEEVVEKRPVLLFLHGVGEGFVSRKQMGHLNLLQQGPPKNLANVADDHPLRTRFNIVAPQLPERETLWSEREDDVREIVARYTSHGEKLYLMGFSKGGLGTFELCRAVNAVAVVAIDASPMLAPPQQVVDRVKVGLAHCPFWAIYTNHGEPAYQRLPQFNELLTNDVHPTLDDPPTVGAKVRTLVVARAGRDTFGSRHTGVCDDVSKSVSAYQWLLAH